MSCAATCTHSPFVHGRTASRRVTALAALGQLITAGMVSDAPTLPCWRLLQEGHVEMYYQLFSHVMLMVGTGGGLLAGCWLE